MSTCTYSSAGVLTNVLRSIALGFGTAILSDTVFLYSQQKGYLKWLPGLSAFFYSVAQLIAIVFDVSAPLACSGRVHTMYIFIYGSQLCLDLYQLQKTVIVAKSSVILRSSALVLFAGRLASICYSYATAYDLPLPTGICATGFPVINLVVEKSVLIVYNLGNLAILIYVGYKDSANIGLSAIMGELLFRDGFSFTLGVILDTLSVIGYALFKAGAGFSLLGNFANASNMIILFFQNSLAVRYLVTRQKTSTRKSEK